MTNLNPAISVLMPVKNLGPYIEKATRSILEQTFSDFEFIIVDDHSTDDSWQILTKLAEQDARIKLVRSPAPGIVAALNHGLTLCSAPLIARMDGDDYAYPSRFEKQVAFMRDNPDVHICGSWVRLFQGKDEVWHFRETNNHIKTLMLFKRSGFNHNAVILRREVYDRFPYESDFEFCEDYRLWCQVAANSEFRMHNLQEVLVDYRIHASQVCSTRQKLQDDLRVQILRDFYADLNIPLSNKEFILLQQIRLLPQNTLSIDLYDAEALLSKIEKLATKRFADEHGLFEQYRRWLKEAVGHVQ